MQQSTYILSVSILVVKVSFHFSMLHHMACMVHRIGQKIITYWTLRNDKTLEMDFRDVRFDTMVMMLTVLIIMDITVFERIHHAVGREATKTASIT